MAFLDGPFAPAKKAGDQVGLTKKGNGSNWMLVIDGNGLPLGFHLDSATTAEVKLAERTLDTICVPRPRGRPKQRPTKLVADRGYDRSDFRRVLRQRAIHMRIPPRRRPATWRAKRGHPVVARKDDYRQRYTVERSCVAGQFPAVAHALGTPQQCLSGFLHRGGAAIRLRRVYPVPLRVGSEAVVSTAA